MDSTAVGGSEGGYNGGLSALASPGAGGGSGSALQQQGRRGTGEEDDRRRSKTARTVGGDGFSMLSKPLLVNGLVLGPGGGGGGDQAPPQMLCFSSSPGPEAGSMGRSSRGASLPFFYRSSPAARNTVYGSRSFNGAGASAAARGPFTPSQWLELEHQALIYKYITAKMAVPSNLLGPIKRSVDSAACPSFSGRSLALGWGSFYLGADPEPGRCRRTDGKKWRCSRDAVADQKYCERHLNRGRQRSRKPVEHHPARIAAVAIPRPAMEGGAARSSQQPSLSDPSAHLNRFASRKLGDGAGASMASPPVVKEEEEETILLPDLRSEASATDSQTEFGFVPSASLVNPVHGREVAADYRSPIPNPDIGFPPDPTLLSISIPAPSSSARSSVGEPAAYAQPVTIPLSVGGPLGEVLQSTGGSSSGKGPSALNFMSRGSGWDGRGSTTGVLQSAGSGGSSCNDLLVLGSSIVRSSSSSLPLL